MDSKELDRINSELDLNDLRIDVARGEIKRAEEKLTMLFNKKKRLSDMKTAIITSSGTDWDYLLDEKNIGDARHTALEKAMEKYNRNYTYGLRVEGYTMSTGQAHIRVTLGKEEDIPLAMEGLNTLLPYIKPIVEDNRRNKLLIGMKLFSIFEHTLAEHGSYVLAIDEANDKYLIINLGYGNEVRYKAKDLKDALEYILKNHWYDPDRSTEEEDDDE